MATLTTRIDGLERAMREQFAATRGRFKSAVRDVLRWIDANGTDEQPAMIDRIPDDLTLFERAAYTSDVPADILDRLTQAWDEIEIAERLPAFERWVKDTGGLQA